MASNTKNVKLGVCRVYFGGVDLGYTKGGVEVSVTTETHKIQVDQFGNSDINQIIIGRNVMVKCPLAETTLDNLVAIMPGATASGPNTDTTPTGTISFAAQPADGDKITLNGVDFMFKTVPVNQTDIKIGATLALTAATMLALLQGTGNAAATNPVTFTVTGTTPKVLNIAYAVPGTAGNSYTLAKTEPGTNITLSGATLTGGTHTARNVAVSNGTGLSLLDTCQALVLHPTTATDKADDFLIPKANASGALTYAYKLDSERIFNVEFMGYPDPVTQKLFIVGDPGF